MCFGPLPVVATETTKERLWEAEVDRVAGEIALKSPDPDATKADRYFERALAGSKQNRGNSALLRALRDSGVTRASRSRLANCSLRFMAGSPKASTRAI
jgi:hypothetical protein